MLVEGLLATSNNTEWWGTSHGEQSKQARKAFKQGYSLNSPLITSPVTSPQSMNETLGIEFLTGEMWRLLSNSSILVHLSFVSLLSVKLVLLRAIT